MSPRTPKQFEEIREEKKTLIMDVALEHFANKGFHATTISHIAKHAGISKGLLYNYFRSKEELLGEIISRSATEIYSSFDLDRDGILSEFEFEHFLRRVFSILRDNRQFWKLIIGIMLQHGVYQNLLEIGLDRKGPDGITLKEFLDNMNVMLMDYFRRRTIQSGTESDPETEMLMFINTVKGFALTLLFADELYPGDLYEKTIDTLIKKYR